MELILFLLVFFSFVLLAEVEYADIAEFYARAMSAEADISFFVEESRVVAVVYGERIHRPAVRSYSIALAGLADIGIDDNLSVDSHRYMVADSLYLFSMPLLDGAEIEMLGSYDAVDRAVNLIRPDAFVAVRMPLIDRVVMVEYLDFHAMECCVDSGDVFTGAYADTVVHGGDIEKELEAQYKIAVVFLCIKIPGAAVLSCDIDIAVNGNVCACVAVPFAE